MDTWVLAEDLAKVANSCGLSDAERVWLIAQFASILLANTDISTVTSPIQVRETKPIETVSSKSKVIANKGDTSVCSSCGKHVFTVNRPIYEDGMSISQFLAAFTPMNPDKPLTTELLEKVSNIDGNVQIDCPLCSGDMALDLIGKRNRQAQAPSVSAPDVTVGSIGREQLGL